METVPSHFYPDLGNHYRMGSTPPPIRLNSSPRSPPKYGRRAPRKESSQLSNEIIDVLSSLTDQIPLHCGSPMKLLNNLIEIFKVYSWVIFFCMIFNLSS